MFYFNKTKNLNLYKSSIFDDENIIYSFTTRTGGNTPYPLANFSMGTAENPELFPNVEDNRRKICEILGVKHENLIIPQQKHTDNIKIVSSINDDVFNCDGLITEVPDLVLMLLFADCVPIIIYAPDRHVISVVHAGWRGTAKSIVKKAINILDEEFHADIKKMKVAIGPAIGQCCYPVSTEVSEELEITIKKDCDNIFTRSIDDDDLVNVDLKKLNARQLGDTGVINIDKSDNCTCCMSSVFYSYRAENGKTGRHAAIASLKK